MGKTPSLHDGTTLITDIGRTVRYSVNIMFYPNKNHFEPILCLKAAAGNREFCIPCNTSYANPATYRCTSKCSSCLSIPPCKSVEEIIKGNIHEIKCNSCNRFFLNSSCLHKHSVKSSYSGGTSVCAVLQICKTCLRVANFYKTKDHQCGTFYCKNCKCIREYNHECYMAPVKERLSNSSKRIRFVFYDLETRQTKTLPGDNSVNIHEPNLSVVQKVCSVCLLNENMNDSCKYCGVRRLVFRGDELIQNLINHVTREGKQFSQTICIAHNAKGFDLQFILRNLAEVKGTRIRPKVILNGTKIMLMQVGECKFVDSLNYMPMPLSALPKAFGLTGEHSKKGAFPHFFNRPENDLYVGHLPPFEDYSPDTMSIEARKEFYEWYDVCKNDYVFDFKKEMLEYCVSDVTILRRACLAYRTIFLNVVMCVLLLNALPSLLLAHESTARISFSLKS
ncbi:uncharacterized protein LOC117171456 isoform X1 [Belonocnema kinseyi]|uniref:uncharacterized protein LOC117171456 isoform X1 n=1 Tax=Belonocnema kinseyi TaxID=2817044 RepID=UPI00143D6962|nr:uncharacterized protein LOC117171456 isoform X1 [Belonocnema kinseyi]